MNIVFTGPAVVNGKRVVRAVLAEMAAAAGFSVQAMVSATTDMVVASNNNFMARKGRKLKAVDARGVKVVTPETFVKMVGGAL